MPISKPDVTATLRAAGVSVGVQPEKILIVGQQTAAATAASGALTQNIGNDKAEDGLYGENAPLAAAIRRVRRKNKETRIDAIGLDDAGGAEQATGTCVFSGTATAAGTIKISVGSKKFNTYDIAVAVGDTATVIGDALEAAITADSTSFVTAANTTGSVALSAVTRGTFGNGIGLEVEGSIAGITTTLTAMNNGAGDPTLTGVLDVIGNERYKIFWQFDNDTDEMTDLLESRFNVTNDIRDGIGFVCKVGTYAGLLSALGAINLKTLSPCLDKTISTDTKKGPWGMEIPFVKVCEFAAIRSLRRTDDAVLGDLVIARSQNDARGGIWQNSKPYFNTPLSDQLVPAQNNGFTDLEVESLKDAGGWVVGPNRAYSQMITGEVVTTYKTDSAGNPDPTWGFLNYVDTSTASREYIVNNTRAKYPQYRATGGKLIPGVDSASEASIAAYVSELYQDLGEFALVNTGTGTVNGENVDYDKLFRENLTVTLNPVTGKFSVSCKLYNVVQLRGIDYDLAIAFEI